MRAALAFARLVLNCVYFFIKNYMHIARINKSGFPRGIVVEREKKHESRFHGLSF